MHRIRSPRMRALLAGQLALALLCGARETARAQPPAAEDGAVTIEEAIRFALERNPALASAAAERRARESDASQSARRPNPALHLELENWAGSGPFADLDRSEATLELSQTVETGGKRGKREALAREEAGAAADLLRARRSELIRDVRVAFAELLAAQEQAGLAEETERAADSAAESVAERVRIGGAPAAEESRARLALADARRARARAARAIDAARLGLAAHWGGVPEISRAAGRLESIEGFESLEDILARVDEAPTLAAARRAIAREEAALALERSLGAPDLDVSGGVRRFQDEGATALLAGIGIPLPLFDRRSDAKGAAMHRLARARADSAAARVAVETRLRSLHAALDGAREESAVLQDTLLPQARAALKATEDAFARGLLRLTDVLETRRTLRELEARSVDALLTANTLHAGLREALGSFEASAGSLEVAP